MGREYYLQNRDRIRAQQSEYHREYHLQNRDKISASAVEYRLLKKEQINKRHRRYNAKLRLAALIVLGGKCALCGFCRDDSALQIDHIVPIKKPRSKRLSTATFYNLVVNGSRDNLQVLCANCHAVKTATEQ